MPILDCDKVPTFAQSIIADNLCSSIWYGKTDPVRSEMFAMRRHAQTDDMAIAILAADYTSFSLRPFSKDYACTASSDQ